MINVILACAGAALAGSAWNGPATVESTAPAAVVAQAAGAAAVGVAEARSEELAPSFARACVYALSKNICESHLFNVAHPESDGCPGTDCKTIYVPEARWRIPLMSNRQNCSTCSDTGKCDEYERFDGSIEAIVQWTLRYNGPCAFRGCFEGRWEHWAQDGRLYTGRVTGTMGVGTHRFNQMCCETSADRTCERCLDVEFIREPGSDVGTWRIAVEGTFEGRAAEIFEPIPDKAHFSISGDFYMPGDRSGPWIGGPQEFPWRFVGTVDGVFIDYCN